RGARQPPAAAHAADRALGRPHDQPAARGPEARREIAPAGGTAERAAGGRKRHRAAAAPGPPARVHAAVGAGLVGAGGCWRPVAGGGCAVSLLAAARAAAPAGQERPALL